MELLQRAEQIGWYHSMELTPGRWTEGMFDMRPYVDRYGLPERMDGMRVLEVGTWDGFWAFEMERRGAQVVAIDVDREEDLDWAPRRRPDPFPDQLRGEGFRILHELRGSTVERVSRSVYDALPADLGTFDLVFCGSVLIHLRDQLLAIERIANLVKPGGTFISAEEYDKTANRIPRLALSRFQADVNPTSVFWLPNVRAWKRMFWTAGFDRVVEHGKFAMKANEGWSVAHVVLHGHR